jgi:polysaccharide export outer membrane protein
MLFRQFTFIGFLLLSAVSPLLGQNNNAPPALPPHKPLSQREPPPGSSQYKLRSGDTIQLDFRLSPELNQTVLIDPDGSVGLLVIGRIQLAGLTVQDARQLIISKESEHLKNPEVNMQVTNFQHYYVVVAGEVYQPQKIEMRDDMTALQAIVLAGGVKISGRETQVLLYRRVNAEFAEVHKLNMRIKKTSQLENDMKLEPGDLILVPRNKVESVARYVRIVGFGYNFQPTAF